MSNNPSLTRRAALMSLGATAAVGATSVAAMAKAVDRAEWERAAARNRGLADEVNAHPAIRTRPDHPDYPRLDREQTALEKQWHAAEDELMRLPAPDLRAAIEKLEIYGDQIGEDPDVFALVLADFHRIAGGASHG